MPIRKEYKAYTLTEAEAVCGVLLYRNTWFMVKPSRYEPDVFYIEYESGKGHTAAINDLWKGCSDDPRSGHRS